MERSVVLCLSPIWGWWNGTAELDLVEDLCRDEGMELLTRGYVSLGDVRYAYPRTAHF